MLNGEKIDDTHIYRIGLQNYHFRNMEDFFSLTYEEVEQNGRPRMLSTSCREILDEYLSTHLSLDHHVCDRIVIL